MRIATRSRVVQLPVRRRRSAGGVAKQVLMVAGAVGLATLVMYEIPSLVREMKIEMM